MAWEAWTPGPPSGQFGSENRILPPALHAIPAQTREGVKPEPLGTRWGCHVRSGLDCDILRSTSCRAVFSAATLRWRSAAERRANSGVLVCIYAYLST